MNFDSVKELDKNYVLNSYNRFDVAFESGEGSYLYDFDGKKYIDFSSGIGVNVFGIGDEKWSNTIIDQVKHLTHVSNLYYTLPQAKLAELICQKTGMKKVFYANSGAEANEGAIKCARKYSFDKYGEGRYEIITLENSFHGRTMATLTATGQDVFHQYFGPFLEGFKYAKANDIKDLKNKISSKTCAIMIEVVQGEGGVLPLNKNFMKEIEKICKEKDLLFMIDEVQTGNGRTGYLYAYMAFDLKPNVVTTAKGIGGGLPFGAVIFDEKCENTLGYGAHATTFGGNPVVAAGAYSILSRLDDKFLDEVKEKGQIIKKILSTSKNVTGIDGMGLMLGISTNKESKEILSKCLGNGVVLLTAKEKIRLLPPLNIPMEVLKKGINILKDVIDE